MQRSLTDVPPDATGETGSMRPGTSSATHSCDRVHWSRVREAGTVSGLRILYRLHRLLGRRFYRVILTGVAFWFMLTRADLRRSSLDWLRSHAAFFPEHWAGRRPGRVDVIRHFHAFGEAILDKALAWTAMPVEQDFTLADEALVRATLADPGGQLVIGSHFGNLEYCRGFVQSTHARIVNVLVHDRNSVHFVEAMARLSPDSRLNVFQVDELDVGRVLDLKRRIEAGEWLFIAGDRVPLSGDARTVTVDFLGRPARVPVGPYLLAKTLGCPVKLMFANRRGDTVHVDLQHFSDAIELPRGAREEALSAYATRFATALEAQTGAAPFQWFNFYPYWTR